MELIYYLLGVPKLIRKKTSIINEKDKEGKVLKAEKGESKKKKKVGKIKID